MMNDRADLKKRTNSVIAERIRGARHNRATGNTYQKENNEGKRKKVRKKEKRTRLEWRAVERKVGYRWGSPVSARIGDRRKGQLK